MRRAASLALALAVAAGPVFGWSCASDEPLVPQVSAEERARISAEVAAERAAAERLECLRAGLDACGPAPAASSPAPRLPFPVVPTASQE